MSAISSEETKRAQTPTMQKLKDRINDWVFKDKDSEHTSLRSLQPKYLCKSINSFA